MNTGHWWVLPAVALLSMIIGSVGSRVWHLGLGSLGKKIPPSLRRELAPLSVMVDSVGSKVRHSGLRPLSTKIPVPLRRELSEARSCYGAKAYTGTVVMVRRTLEGVCASHNIKIGRRTNLQAALQEMASRGLLDGRLLEWTHLLRVLGNEGAHYTGSPVSHEDASDALLLAEKMLDYLYVTQAQFEELKERRNARLQADNDARSSRVSEEDGDRPLRA